MHKCTCYMLRANSVSVWRKGHSRVYDDPRVMWLFRSTVDFNACCIICNIVSRHHRVDRILSFFSSRLNWVYPTHSRRRGGHPRLRERGWGSTNSDEGTDTVVLYVYMYVPCTKGRQYFTVSFTFSCCSAEITSFWIWTHMTARKPGPL